MTAPECDVPIHVCHDGNRGPMVTRAEHCRAAEYPDDVRLVCLACGDGIVGSDDDLAQAERARVAWQQVNQ